MFFLPKYHKTENETYQDMHRRLAFQAQFIGANRPGLYYCLVLCRFNGLWGSGSYRL